MITNENVAQAHAELMAKLKAGEEMTEQEMMEAYGIKPKEEPKPLFTFKSATQWCDEAAGKVMPQELWMDTWYEGEVCCLFADSNLGKSIYAVQIGEAVAAKGKRVMYFDFELSDKQFQMRYTDESGNRHPFPETFFRAEVDPDVVCEYGVCDMLMDGIEQVVLDAEASVVIIDNITYINTLTESADAASQLMLLLLGLKKKHGWSVLALAHTPKRLPSSPLTQNDLAGSKRLFNFFDSVFAIGRSMKDEHLRYIKQLKVRHGAFKYGADNVVVSEIVKEGTMLRFNSLHMSEEQRLLVMPAEKERAEFMRKVMDMSERGLSQRVIAEQLGVSRSKVRTVVERNRM